MNNTIIASTNPIKCWKHDWKVLCPINAPIDANNALMMIVDTTQKATGRTTVSSAFPMYLIMFITLRRGKGALAPYSLVHVNCLLWMDSQQTLRPFFVVASPFYC